MTLPHAIQIRHTSCWRFKPLSCAEGDILSSAIGRKISCTHRGCCGSGKAPEGEPGRACAAIFGSQASAGSNAPGKLATYHHTASREIQFGVREEAAILFASMLVGMEAYSRMPLSFHDSQVVPSQQLQSVATIFSVLKPTVAKFLQSHPFHGRSITPKPHNRPQQILAEHWCCFYRPSWQIDPT